jgi:hypothetical protein
MSKRKTNEEFIVEVYNLVGEEYNVVGNYVNAHQYVEMNHFSEISGVHSYSVRPTDFLLGKRCKCNIKKENSLEDSTVTKRKRTVKNKLIVSLIRKRGGQARTHEEFLLEVIKLVNDEYAIIGKYINSKVKIELKHNICNHTYEVAPNDFLKGRRCPKCARNLKKSTEIFKKEVYSLVNDEYMVLGEYFNDKTKILMLHTVCGKKYQTTPNTFLNGHRCADCSRKTSVVVKKRPSYRKSIINGYKVSLPPFEKSLGFLFPELIVEWSDKNQFDVYQMYSKSSKKAWWKCRVCNHEWETRVSTRTSRQKSGCPLCNESKGEKKIRAFLFTKEISFVSQKIFDGLIGMGGGNLSYDFFLPKQNILIEYQGKQHETFVEMIHLEEVNFKKQLEHDRRKREYAQRNAIQLLEIWYWDYERVEEIISNILTLNNLIDMTG